MRNSLVILIVLLAMTLVGCKREPAPTPDANQTQTEITAPEAQEQETPEQPEMPAQEQPAE